MVFFYLALMLESITTLGHLRYSESVPYSNEMLSAMTGSDIRTVNKAMSVFQQLGLITILEDLTIFIPAVPTMTGRESESAERVRKYRERKKQELLLSNEDELEGNNINIKRNIEQQERREKSKHDLNLLFPHDMSPSVKHSLLEYLEYRKERKAVVTKTSLEKIIKSLETLPSDEVRIECIERSIRNGWTGLFPDQEKNSSKKRKFEGYDLEMEGYHAI